MNLKNTLRLGVASLALMSVVALAPSANAQGGFQMPPEVQKKIKAWQKFSEDHKKLMVLGDQISQIGEMSKMAGYELDKKQAGVILKVIDANKSKTSLTEEEAGAMSKQLTTSLSAKQIKKMTTIETPRQKMQKARAAGGAPGGGGGGAARPGGAAGGGMPSFPDPPAKGWNPLNPDSFPFEQAKPRMKEGMNKLVAELKARAK